MKTTSVFLSSVEERERLRGRGIDADVSLRGLLAQILGDDQHPRLEELASIRTGNPERGRPRRAAA